MKLLIMYTDGSSPFCISAPIETVLQHIKVQAECCPEVIESITIVMAGTEGGDYFVSDNV